MSLQPYTCQFDPLTLLGILLALTTRYDYQFAPLTAPNSPMHHYGLAWPFNAFLLVEDWAVYCR